MFPATARLRNAYLATSYVVFCPDRRVVLRIGRKPPPLRWGIARQAAFVTAANARGAAWPRWANLRACRRLHARLAGQGLRVRPGEGRGDAGDWPAEPSLLVFGLNRRAAAALGRALCQNAVVHARRGAAVMLVALR